MENYKLVIKATYYEDAEFAMNEGYQQFLTTTVTWDSSYRQMLISNDWDVCYNYTNSENDVWDHFKTSTVEEIDAVWELMVEHYDRNIGAFHALAVGHNGSHLNFDKVELISYQEFKS